MSDIEDDAVCDKTFSFRLTSAERAGLDWIAGERTREVREASRVSDLKRTAADSLRELIRGELDRRGWPGPGKPASGKRKGA
jgi:hypothetical protein